MLVAIEALTVMAKVYKLLSMSHSWSQAASNMISKG
jgi:hypothetical protein